MSFISRFSLWLSFFLVAMAIISSPRIETDRWLRGASYGMVFLLGAYKPRPNRDQISK